MSKRVWICGRCVSSSGLLNTLRAGCLKASGAHQSEIWTFFGSLNLYSPHPALSLFFFFISWKHNEPLWKCGNVFSLGVLDLNWPLKCRLRGWEGRRNSCTVYELSFWNRIKTYASLHNSSTSAYHLSVAWFKGSLWLILHSDGEVIRLTPFLMMLAIHIEWCLVKPG